METDVKELHPRYDWLDQARGLVVLMLIISMSTAEYAGDMVLGERFLGSPMLGHGYDYYDGSPALITFIDAGQALFVFMMGFVGYMAFTSRLSKRGVLSAIFYALRRMVLLYALAAIDSVFLNYLEHGEIRWAEFLYLGTFSCIALGSLAAFASILICSRADARMLGAFALVLVHAVLYEFPQFDHREWYEDVLNPARFPFGAFGLCIVAVIGTCFGQWYLQDPNDPMVGFRNRIAPVSTLAMIGAYCMDWIQSAEHHDTTASLQLLAVAYGGYMLMIFYTFGLAGVRFPLLSSLGKNLLLLFAVGGIAMGIYIAVLPKTLLMASPFYALLLVGILPILALGLFAKFLEWRGIMVRA